MEPALIAIAVALCAGWGMWGWLVQRNVSRAERLGAELDELERHLGERN